MKYLLLFVIGCCTAAGGFAQQRAQHVSVHLRYWLYLPEGYHAGSAEQWPLVIFLHGSGERGNDLDKVKVHGPPKLAGQQAFPFMLVSPQCPDGERWNVYMLNKLLDALLAEYRVDPDRVYLTGLSMGGQGTWQWALSNPERFAAIAPICGRSVSGPVWRLRHLPIWVFHGAKDTVVPLEESEKMIRELEQSGSVPLVTIYPEAGHDSWTEAYNNPDLYTWMLQQRRNPQFPWKGDPELYPLFTGTYQLNDGRMIEVALKDGQLIARFNGQEVVLQPENMTGAFYAGVWTDNRLVFSWKGNRKVRSLVLATTEGVFSGRRK